MYYYDNSPSYEPSMEDYRPRPSCHFCGVEVRTGDICRACDAEMQRKYGHLADIGDAIDHAPTADRCTCGAAGCEGAR